MVALEKLEDVEDDAGDSPKESGSGSGSRNIIEMYLAEIGQYGLLTREGEAELGRNMLELSERIDRLISTAPLGSRMYDRLAELEDGGGNVNRLVQKVYRAACMPGKDPDISGFEQSPDDCLGEDDAAEDDEEDSKMAQAGRNNALRIDLRKLFYSGLKSCIKLDPVEESDRQCMAVFGIGREEAKSLYSQAMRLEAELKGYKREMAECNYRLVVSIAKRREHEGIPLADRIQSGNLGLIKAIDRFDYRKGFRFSTYAGWWIRNTIQRERANTGSTIRLPVNMREKQRKVNRFMAENPSADLDSQVISEGTGIAECQVRLVQKASLLLNTVPLDNTYDTEDGTVSLTDLLPDVNCLNPETAVSMQELTGVVHDALASVGTERDKQIIIERLWRERTLKDVGDDFRLTRERIRQIENAMKDRLRAYLEDVHGIKDYP